MVASGFKNITIFDGDIIEKSNLGRQILFNLEDIGKYKTIVAKNKLLKTNPNCNIITYEDFLSNRNIDLLINSDFVIDTTDDWKTSKIINNFCVKKSISYVFASAVNYSVQICLFKNKEKHVCLNCLFPNSEDPELARCETVGISSVCAGLAGLISTQKVVNTILDIKDENNILTLVNSNNFSLDNIIVKNNLNCILNNS